MVGRDIREELSATSISLSRPNRGKRRPLFRPGSGQPEDKAWLANSRSHPPTPPLVGVIEEEQEWQRRRRALTRSNNGSNRFAHDFHGIPISSSRFLNEIGANCTGLSRNASTRGAEKKECGFPTSCAYCLACPTGRPTWSCIDCMMDRRLNGLFQMPPFNGRYVEPGTGFTQTSWKTISWSLPRDVGHRTSRFGVVGDDSRIRTGVTVTGVRAGSPALGTLQNGDVITAINGEMVEDTDSFFDLVRCSPRTMRYDFTRNGRQFSSNATLAW